jgi:hypothetical protein
MCKKFQMLIWDYWFFTSGTAKLVWQSLSLSLSLFYSAFVDTFCFRFAAKIYFWQLMVEKRTW